MASVTTSVRLDQSLARRLEREAARLSRGKNWIISKALEEFLSKRSGEEFLAEARRQSLRASRKRNRREEAFWETAADARGWK